MRLSEGAVQGYRGSAGVRIRLGFSLLVLFFLMLSAFPLVAWAGMLSGTVSGQQLGQSAEPLAGASVSVIDPSSGAVLASTTSDAFGGYSLSAPSGIFDVSFAPPPLQPFAMTTLHEVDLTTSRTLDVVLVERGLVHLTGVVRNSAGSPIENAKVILATDNGNPTEIRTGADGSYSLAVLPGTYKLSAFGYFPGGAGGWEVDAGEIEINEDRTREIILPPTSMLTVQVLGADDAPIVGATVEIPQLQGGTELSELGLNQVTSGGFGGKSDAQGRLQIAVFTGSQASREGSVVPPQDTGYGTAHFSVPSINQDTTVVVRFQGSSEEAAEDVEPPTLSVEPEGGSQNGWFSGEPVSVHAVAVDPDLVLLSCTVGAVERLVRALQVGESLELDLEVTGEGRHQVSCVAIDTAGNTTTRGTTVRIDRTPPPVVILTADRQPDYAGNGGWYKNQVTVSSMPGGEDPLLEDGSAGSGLDLGTIPAAQTFSTSGPHQAVGSIEDVAGNISSVVSLIVNVDATAPSSSLSCPEDVQIGSAGSATWSDSDAESGLIGPATGVVGLATEEVGWHTAVHSTSDNVGHTASSECRYQVIYPFAVAGKTVAPPEFNRFTGNKSKVTVEFSLGGDRGLTIFRSGYPMVQPVGCTTGAASGQSFPAVAAAPLRYRPNQGTYEYALESRALGKGCFALEMGLVDGTTHPVWLRF